jgi:hypothetical protein
VTAKRRKNQPSARSYDAKAQIASVGYLLTIGVVRIGFEERPGGWAWPGAPAAAFGLLVVVLPVVLFAYVLWPRYRFRAKALPTHRIAPRTITMSWFEGRSGREVAAEANAVDWEAELGFEIEKLRELRNHKRSRFLFALTVSFVSFAVLLARIAVLG